MRVQVSNILVLGIWVIAIKVQVLGKYMIVRYLVTWGRFSILGTFSCRDCCVEPWQMPRRDSGMPYCKACGICVGLASASVRSSVASVETPKH